MSDARAGSDRLVDASDDVSRSAQRTEVIRIELVRKLLGRDQPGGAVEVADEVGAAHAPTEPPPTQAPMVVVTCPNCAMRLDPPPRSTRLCSRCRYRIVVRHIDGRTVYLTEAAVEVFEAERQREAMEQAWSRQRGEWLQLGRLVGAPAVRRLGIAEAPLTAAAVKAARTLYLTTVERAVRAARRDKRWDEVARLRRRQAAALFDEAGGRPPPSADVVTLHRDGVAATLRELAAVARDVELVGASCCAACRADGDRVFRIADELRTSRLPHPGCPRGLCACDWWPAAHVPPTKRRRTRPAVPSPARAPDATATGIAGAPTELDGP